MQRVDLHPSIIERLRAEDLGETWQRQLLEAGLLATVPSPRGQGWSPQGAVRELAGDLAALLDCEARIRAVEVHKPFTGGAVHPGLPITIGFSFWAAANFVSSAVIGVGLTAVAWGALGLVGLIYAVWFFRKKAALLEALDLELRRVRVRLVQDVEEVFGRSFVARIGRRLLTCEPHRIWAAGRLQALPRPGRADEELTSLRRDLQELAEAQEAGLRAAIAEPPEAWVDLSADIRDLVDRLAEGGHPAPATRQQLEALLVRSAAMESATGS